MHVVYSAGALIVGAASLLALLAAALPLLLGRGLRVFWALARISQLLAIAYLVSAVVATLTGEPPRDRLAWVYLMSPIAVAFFAEQLRIVAALSVLERHGFESSAALRDSIASGKTERKVASVIADETLRREVTLVAIGALVVAFLAWRAWLIS